MVLHKLLLYDLATSKAYPNLARSQRPSSIRRMNKKQLEEKETTDFQVSKNLTLILLRKIEGRLDRMFFFVERETRVPE